MKNEISGGAKENMNINVRIGRPLKNRRELKRLLMRLLSRGGTVLEEKDGYVVIRDSRKRVHIIGYLTREEEKELKALYG